MTAFGFSVARHDKGGCLGVVCLDWVCTARLRSETATAAVASVKTAMASKVIILKGWFEATGKLNPAFATESTEGSFCFFSVSSVADLSAAFATISAALSIASPAVQPFFLSAASSVR